MNNLPVNLLPVTYSSQSHGQSSYSSDDLPKTVVATLSPGSNVKSMDFHPLQQIYLLGKPLLVRMEMHVLLLSLVFVCYFFYLFYLFIYLFIVHLSMGSWNKYGRCHGVGYR